MFKSRENTDEFFTANYFGNWIDDCDGCNDTNECIYCAGLLQLPISMIPDSCRGILQILYTTAVKAPLDLYGPFTNIKPDDKFRKYYQYKIMSDGLYFSLPYNSLNVPTIRQNGCKPS